MKKPVFVEPETQIVNNILLVLCSHPKYRGKVKVFRNNTGATEVGDRFIRFGEKGSPDILGMIAPTGRFLGLEVKTVRGKVSENQSRWHEEAVKYGAAVFVVRSLDEALRVVDAVLVEEEGKHV